MTPASLAGVDLVVTTYGLTHRLPWLRKTEWPLVVLDEAQAIKNPGAKQARAVKALRGRSRVALTGTPVENRLMDLWSIFDFLNPGLLGSARAFAAFAKHLGERPGGFAPLRELTRPYILRRLKTDRSVIADLPEKTELRAYCGLSTTQAALYQASVRSLAEKLERLDGSPGIERRGVVLAYLMRLKQICNHPSQWLKDGDWAAEASGKFSRLRDQRRDQADAPPAVAGGREGLCRQDRLRRGALLAGRFDQSVMAHVCRQKTGLFPAATEITYQCTCPDGGGGGWLCKHVAATLYGVGVRLDEDPEMLFRLRQVAHAELLTRATAALAGATPPKRGARRAIAGDRLAAVFGIELETGPTPRARRPRRPSRSR